MQSEDLELEESACSHDEGTDAIPILDNLNLSDDCGNNSDTKEQLQDIMVTFDPKGSFDDTISSVFVLGSWDSWSEGVRMKLQDGRYYCIVSNIEKKDSSKKVEFKFFINGIHWVIDAKQPIEGVDHHRNNFKILF